MQLEQHCIASTFSRAERHCFLSFPAQMLTPVCYHNEECCLDGSARSSCINGRKYRNYQGNYGIFTFCFTLNINVFFPNFKAYLSILQSSKVKIHRCACSIFIQIWISCAARIDSSTQILLNRPIPSPSSSFWKATRANGASGMHDDFSIEAGSSSSSSFSLPSLPWQVQVRGH